MSFTTLFNAPAKLSFARRTKSFITSSAWYFSDKIALAELSTRQIASATDATGMAENKIASKQGGSIAKQARIELEKKTGQKIVTADNFLSLKNSSEKLNEDK